MKSTYLIEIITPKNKGKIKKTLILIQKHQLIAKNFNFGF